MTTVPTNPVCACVPFLNFSRPLGGAGVLPLLLLVLAPVAAQAQCPGVIPAPTQWSAGDELGFVVDVDGDVAIVGAPGESTPVLLGGAAYVYRRSGAYWGAPEQITSHDLAGNDVFGSAVAVSGDWCAVGAWGDDDAGSLSGAVYMFEFDGINWVEQQKLLPASVLPSDQFGFAIDMDADRMVVGARLADKGPIIDTGAAYVFHYDGVSWVEESRITALDAGTADDFGGAVAIHGDRVVVGARFDNAPDLDTGSMYAFHRVGNSWVQQAKLVRPVPEINDHLGRSVSIHGDWIAGGAPGVGSLHGRVTMFHFGPGGWAFDHEASLTSPSPLDSFGSAVRLLSDILVVGADGATPAGGTNSGAAYVFRFDAALGWTEDVELSPTVGASGDRFGRAIGATDEAVVVGSPLAQSLGSFTGGIDDFVIDGEDCDGNGQYDFCDIYSGSGIDTDGDGVLDACVETQFVRGNCNSDASVNIADAVFLLNLLFPQGTPAVPTCDDACDANDDGSQNIADAVAILGSLFGNPPAPLPAPMSCGPDPSTVDAFDCQATAGCP